MHIVVYAFTRVSDVLDHFSRLFMQVALSIIVALTMAEVVARNVVGGSITWVEEVAVSYIGTWFVFIGAAHALRVGMLISLDYFVERASGRTAFVIFMLSQAVIMLFLAVIIFYGTKLSIATMSQPSPALQLPMGAAYFGIVAGCAIMAVHTVTAILDRLTEDNAL